eukprot:g448.t1
MISVNHVTCPWVRWGVISKTFQKMETQKRSKSLTTRLYSADSSVALIAAAEGLRETLEPFAASVRDQNTPLFILKYFHGINMGIVLCALGYYGCGYLGWTIKNSESIDAKIMARELHPKLAIGMTIFFALGGFGGLTSLVVQNKPIFESAHVWTAIAGLTCLLFQGMLTLFFEDAPDARQAHALFGTAILTLFTVHMGLGVKLALSL